MKKATPLSNKVSSKKAKLLLGILVVIIVILIYKFNSFVGEQKTEFKKRQQIKTEKKIKTSNNKQLNIDQVAAIKSEINKLEEKVVSNEEKKMEIEKNLLNKIDNQNIIISKLEKTIDSQKGAFAKSLESTNDLVDKNNKIQRNKYNTLEDKLKEIRLTNTKGKALKTISLPPLKKLGFKNNNISSSSVGASRPTEKIAYVPVVKKAKIELFDFDEPKVAKAPIVDSKKKSRFSKNNNNSTTETVKKKKEAVDEDIGYTLNLGITKAITLMGADAPTTSKGKSDPIPVLLSFEGSVLSGNGSSQSLDKCMALTTATGDLRTERANLRLSKISCITADGKERIEAEVQGWVIGEDGKPGLSGVVVTKAGSVIAKGLLAGFLQGIANAFSAAPTLLTDNGAEGTSTVTAAASFGEGMASGTSDALGVIADYYIEMAKDLYPVIEIKGGRKVSILLKGGEKLTRVRFNKLFIGDTFETDMAILKDDKTPKVFKRL